MWFSSIILKIRPHSSLTILKLLFLPNALFTPSNIFCKYSLRFATLSSLFFSIDSKVFKAKSILIKTLNIFPSKNLFCWPPTPPLF